MKNIALIDTGVCNLASITNAFDRIGCEVQKTNLVDDVLNASAIILLMGSEHLKKACVR